MKEFVTVIKELKQRMIAKIGKLGVLKNLKIESDQKIFYKKHDRNNYKLGEVRHAQITESVRGDV